MPSRSRRALVPRLRSSCTASNDMRQNGPREAMPTERLPVLLRMHELQGIAQTERGGLPRLLLLREREMPAHPAAETLLLLMRSSVDEGADDDGAVQGDPPHARKVDVAVTGSQPVPEPQERGGEVGAPRPGRDSRRLVVDPDRGDLRGGHQHGEGGHAASARRSRGLSGAACAGVGEGSGAMVSPRAIEWVGKRYNRTAYHGIPNGIRREPALPPPCAQRARPALGLSLIHISEPTR